MSEPKYRYRFPPCAAYDIPAMECWLEDMAAKGLHLSADGFFCGLATFEEGPPRKEKFRLEATATNGGFLSSTYDPDADAVEMNRQMGWEYRARWGNFHIYSAADPNSPELHTDPQVQAITMAALSKHLRGSLLHTLTLLVLYGLLYSEVILFTGAIVLGTGKCLLLVGLLAWDLCIQLRTLFVLSGYRKRLQKGEPLHHRRGYRKRAWVHPAAKLLRAALWAFLIVSWLALWATNITDGNKIQLEDYDAPFPFPTLTEYYPGADVEQQSGILDSQVSVWSDFLAPENYEYSEYAELTLDGESFDCYLTVNYHETRWEWTAAKLAREFASQEGANVIEQSIDKFFGNEPFTATELSIPDADYACFYTKYGLEPHLVLQRGNTVIRVYLSVLGEGPQIGVEELAQIILSHIR